MDLTRPYGGTFLVFSDYMRPAIRLAALMQLPVTYVWSHDSIGLGEDGPTHQPVEHLARLRIKPGLEFVRPADANETGAAWAVILRRNRPAGLVLSRQALPVFDRPIAETRAVVARGGYVVDEAGSADAPKTPQVVLIATGSEVSLALGARAVLEAEGLATRVVSMPCLEWFAEQTAEYRDSVIPTEVTARVSVEAGVSTGWRDIVGDSGATISLDHFGVSADAARLFEEFGFTPLAVADAARRAAGGARA